MLELPKNKVFKAENETILNYLEPYLSNIELTSVSYMHIGELKLLLDNQDEQGIEDFIEKIEEGSFNYYRILKYYPDLEAPCPRFNSIQIGGPYSILALLLNVLSLGKTM